MLLIFLLFLPWYLNAMEITAIIQDDPITQGDIDKWLIALESPNRQPEPVALIPRPQLIASPGSEKSFLLSNQSSSSSAINNAETDYVPVATPGRSPATSPIEHNVSSRSPSSDGPPLKRATISYNSKDQQTRSSESVEQLQDSAESSERPKKFIVHCLFQPCSWRMIYTKPSAPEAYHYLELICIEKMWRHCHATHWSLQRINEYVSEEFRYPLILEEEN